MSENYWIDSRGIFYSENSYHDDVEYRYVVDFNKPEQLDTDFMWFIKHIEDRGKKKAMQELKAQFRGLRELLS